MFTIHLRSLRVALSVVGGRRTALHLSDAQWTQIEAAFPQRRGRSGLERKISNRLAFEAVLHRERTGCP